MSSRYTNFHGDRDVLRIPVIRVAFVLSVLLHTAVFWPWLPQLKFNSANDPDPNQARSRLQVRLARPVIPEPPPAAESRSAPAPKARPSPPRNARAPAPAARQPAPAARQPAAPVLAMEAPGPAAPPPAPVTRPTAPPSAAPVGDLAALIEARRLARGNPAPPPAAANAPAPPVMEDEDARRNRIVAQNLGSGRTPAFGEQPKGSGGIFQIEHLYYDYADFQFYGWNRDIKRNTRQLIEVRLGNNKDIRLAVVRKMIGIIREYEKEDFRWDSERFGRSFMLSARERDSATLEAFLMREFFEDEGRRR